MVISGKTFRRRFFIMLLATVFIMQVFGYTIQFDGTALRVGTANTVQAAGTTIYVSPSGNDNWSGTLPEPNQNGTDGPFRTIAKANETAQAGNTVVIRGGEYEDTIRPYNSGEAGSPIIYKGYTGETVIVKGLPVEDLMPDEYELIETDPYGIYIYDKSYIEIEGITVDFTGMTTNGGPYWGRWGRVVDSDHVTLKNVVFNNCMVEGTSGGICFINSHYNTITECTFHDGNDLLVLVQSDYNLVEDCVFTKGRHTLWCIRAGSYNIIRNNYFHNELQKIGEIYDNGTYSARKYGTLEQDSARYNVVENNIFAYTPHGDGGPYNGIQFAGQYCIIRNNIFYDLRGGGLGMTLYGDEAYYNYQNRIYNNTFVNNEGGGISIPRKNNMAPDYFFYKNILKNNIIANNIYTEEGGRHSYSDWVALRGKPVQIWGIRWDGHLFRNNVIYSSEPDYAVAFGDNSEHHSVAWMEQNFPHLYRYNITNIEPVFRNWDDDYDPAVPFSAEHDFELEDGSPLIDAGEFLTTVVPFIVEGSEGPSSGKSSVISVADPLYFTDGFGIVEGDTVKLRNGEVAVVTEIEYGLGHNRIYLDREVNWSKGMGISLYYEGSAPDMGAVEKIMEEEGTPVNTPTEFVKSVKLATGRWNDGDDWRGMKITVGERDIDVTHLGRWVMGEWEDNDGNTVPGNSQVHTMKIVDAETGEDVAGAAVDVPTADAPVEQFNYVELAQPVTLEAGKAYYVVSREYLGGDYWYAASSEVTTTEDAIVNCWARYSYSQSSGGYKWYEGGASQSIGPVSFIYVISGGPVLPPGEPTPSPSPDPTPSQDPSPSPSPSTSPIPTEPTEFVTEISSGSAWNDKTGWLGMKITVGENDIIIHELGRWVLPGNSGIHTVKIVDAGTKEDIPGASALVDLSGTTPGAFKYAALTTPVRLFANMSYYIVSEEVFGGDHWYGVGTVVNHTDVATVDCAVTRYDSWNTYGSTNNCAEPVSFIYSVPGENVPPPPSPTPSPTPSPSATPFPSATPTIKPTPVPGSWVPPVGIPDPEFGIYDERPARPETWDSPIAGYYYVNQQTGSDSNNQYGTPAKPRKSIPRPIPAGSYVEIHGEYTAAPGSAIWLECQGTAGPWVPGVSGPVWIVGLEDDRPEFTQATRFWGTYAYVENINFRPTANKIGSIQIGTVNTDYHWSSDHLVIRNCDFRGDSASTETAIIIDGSSSTLVTNVVIFNNSMHDYGSMTAYLSGTDQDASPLLIGDYTSSIWVLENIMYNCSAGLRVGGRGSNFQPNRLSNHIYVGRNVAYNIVQAGLASKKASDVIFSENIVHDIIDTPWSPSKGIGFQYETPRLWIINNIIYNCYNGIRGASDEGSADTPVYILGNLIYDCVIEGESLYAGTTDGTGIQINNGNGYRYIIGNTIYNAEIGISNGYYQSKMIMHNNIIQGSSVADIKLGDAATRNYSTLSYTLLGNPAKIVWGDGVVRDLASFRAQYGQGEGCIEGDALFNNIPEKDFSLQDGSDAIDKGIESDVYELFEQLYGLDIRKDIAGNPRPQGPAWDLGAFEYEDLLWTPTPKPTPSPSPEPTSGPAWTTPKGIPEPEFGINETYRMYDDPAKRNTALTYHQNTEGGFYTHYVDNSAPNATDTNNPYGTAETPRKTLPSYTTILPGSVVEIHGGPYTINEYTCQIAGTAEQPVFFRGYSEEDKPVLTSGVFYLMSQYTIVENIKKTDKEIRIVSNPSKLQVHHVAVRNCEFEHIVPNAINLYSQYADCNVNNVVLYNNHIHLDEFDPEDGSFPSVDEKGINCTGIFENVWIVDNLLQNIRSTVIIVSSTSAKNCYVGRNTIHTCGYNGMDFRGVDTIIVSENVIYNLKGWNASSGGTGRAVVFANGGAATNNAWFIFNEIFDCDEGIRVGSGQTNPVYIVGNVIYDIKDGNDKGKAFVAAGNREVYLIDNTFCNIDNGIDWGISGTDGQLIYSGNIMSKIADTGYHIRVAVPAQQTNAEIENSLFYQPGGSIRIVWGGSSPVYTSVDQWQTATGKGVGCIEADPLFADAEAADFRLQAGSPAIDKIAEENSLYQLFETIFNLDIRYDRDGKERPQDEAWDIGAYEY